MATSTATTAILLTPIPSWGSESPQIKRKVSVTSPARLRRHAHEGRPDVLEQRSGAIALSPPSPLPHPSAGRPEVNLLKVLAPREHEAHPRDAEGDESPTRPGQHRRAEQDGRVARLAPALVGGALRGGGRDRLLLLVELTHQRRRRCSLCSASDKALRGGGEGDVLLWYAHFAPPISYSHIPTEILPYYGYAHSTPTRSPSRPTSARGSSRSRGRTAPPTVARQRSPAHRHAQRTTPSSHHRRGGRRCHRTSSP